MWNWALYLGIISAGAWLLLRPLVLYYNSDGLSKVPVWTLLRFYLNVRLHALILWISGVSRTLPSIPDVDRLPGQVLRVLGNNPSRLTLSGTNVYVVGTGSIRLLVDASDGNDIFIQRLLAVFQHHGVEEISDLLVTHGHLDHLGGILPLKQRFPSMRVWKYLPNANRKSDGDGDRRLSLSNATSRQFGIKSLTDGQTFQVPNSKGFLTVVYTPGHCNDHVCFVLEDSQELTAPVLFSGDCVLGVGTCIFDSLADFMASLLKLKACGAATIYPGHGPVVEDAPAKINEYIKHRHQRETEVMEALKKQGELSSTDVVNHLYTPLPYLLRLSATKTIEKHLEKLIKERRVRQVRRARWLQCATYSSNESA